MSLSVVWETKKEILTVPCMGDAALVEDPERGNVLGLTSDGYVSLPADLAKELKDFSIVTWMKGLGTAEYGGLFGVGQE